ncbi:hypothetical protein Tco_0493849 [Tanacetum coccineum]
MATQQHEMYWCRGVDINEQRLELEHFLLTSLTNSAFSVAYILEKQHNAFLSALKNVEDESYNLTSPTLDEMIEVSCRRPGLESDYKEYEATVCDPPEDEMVVSGDDTVEAETNYIENEGKENERNLSKLLEKCSIVQDIIDKKLSILQAPGDFNIDRAICERYRKQEQLWSALNVSKVVAATHGQRYMISQALESFHELVLTHLKISAGDCKTSPEQCISAIHEAM